MSSEWLSLLAFLNPGHQGPYSPYKLCNHSLHIGIIIFPHIDHLSRYGKSYHKDQMVVRHSHLFNRNPYTGKTASLYWDQPPLAYQIVNNAHNQQPTKYICCFVWKMMARSVHKFAHAMTTELSWHVNICDLIWVIGIKIKWKIISTRFELWAHIS